MSLPGSLLQKLVAIVSFFSLFAIATLFTSSVVHAQSNFSPSSYNSDVVYNDHVRAQSILIELSAALICQLAGIDVINPDKGCLTIDPTTQKLGYDPAGAPKGQIGGLIGLSGSMIGSLYQPPVTTGAYIGYLRENFGIQKTYAQDEQGYTFLHALQSIWVQMRNIAYLILVIIFLIIGLTIMLRIKIDPRTVMSIQNQLPKIIVGIVLITFSYAIVGLMIDFMWATTYFGINALASTEATGVDSARLVATQKLLDNPILYVNNILTAGDNGTGGIAGLSTDVGGTFGDVLSSLLLGLFGLDASETSCHSWNPLSWGGCIVEGIKGFLYYLIAIIGFLVVGFAILIALIRTWLSLLRALVYVVVYTILGPLIIVAGLVPGSSFGFGRWIRTILANLTIFPVTVMLFLLAKIFAESGMLNDKAIANFIPPLVVNPSSIDHFGALIAFGLIMLAPELQGYVNSIYKAKSAGVAEKVGAGLGAGMKPGMAIPKGIGNQLWRKQNLDTGTSAGIVRQWAVGTPTSTGFRKKFIRPILGGVFEKKP